MTPMDPSRRTLVSIALVALALGAAAPGALGEWPMDGDNPSHTGVQPTGVNGPAGQWSFEADAEIMAPPAAAYGNLFFGSVNGTLYAIDEVDPKQPEWTLKLDGPIYATPLVSTQTLFVPVGNVLNAISITNRSIKWSYEAVGSIRGSPILESGTVYISSEDKHVYALDEYSGALLWSLKLDDVIEASPAISGLTLVVGTDAGTLFGIHRTEGTEVWRTSLGSSVSSAASISKGIALVGTYGGRLHAVRADDGKELWTYPPSSDPPLDPILTTPASDSGLVYFGSDGLYCVEVDTGELIWHHQTRDFVRGGPAITEGYIVFGSYDGSIRCLDKTTGTVVWQFETSTQIRSAASIDYDKAYLGGRDSELYARSILNRLPPVINGPNALSAEEHESVRFQVDASDPEGNVLSYAWNFGDGNTSHERSPLHEYSRAGTYNATVTVSDGTLTRSFQIEVTVHPYQSKVIGGDVAGVPVALVAGAGAAVLVVAIVVVLLLVRRRRARGQEVVEEGAVVAPPVQTVAQAPQEPVLPDAGKEIAHRPAGTEGPAEWEEQD